jgi:hypothetical protein
VVALAAGLLLAGAFLAGRSRPSEPFRALTDVTAFGGGSAADVINWHGGLLAVGAVSDAGHTIGTVWTSSDGRSWRQLSGSDATPDLSLARVATDGHVLAAIGYLCAPGPGYCGQPSLLSSGDGGTWRRATIAGIEDMSFASIAPLASGFVAVGSRGTNAQFVGAVVAVSSDGLGWSVPASDIAPLKGGEMSGVASGPAGLVAVGRGNTGPSTWQSADGLTWTEHAVGDPNGELTIVDVTYGNGRYVAAGSAGGRAAAWTSVDGLTWMLGPGSPALDSSRMDRVIWTGREFLALGLSDQGNGLGWTSPDGIAWTRLETGEIFSGASITAAARLGALVELFGKSASGQPVAAASGGQ